LGEGKQKKKKDKKAHYFSIGHSQENTGADYQKNMTSILGPVLVNTLINILLNGGNVNIEVTFTDSIKFFMFFKTTEHFIDSSKNLKMVLD